MEYFGFNFSFVEIFVSICCDGSALRCTLRQRSVVRVFIARFAGRVDPDDRRKVELVVGCRLPRTGNCATAAANGPKRWQRAPLV